MKRVIAFLLLALLLPSFAYCSTAADLLNKLRRRVNEVDTAKSVFTDSTGLIWLGMAQERIVKIGGFIPKSVDVTFSSDSTSYALPVDFKKENYVVVRTDDGRWEPVRIDPGFNGDGEEFRCFIGWHTKDSARIYLQSPYFFDQSVRVFYYGTATALTTLSTTVEVTSDLENLIVEEAIGYYYGAKVSLQLQMGVSQQVRQDMGLVK